MSFPVLAYNVGGSDGGKNGHLTGPPGLLTFQLTVANAVRFLSFKNLTQYVHLHNWGAGTLRVGLNNLVNLGINGDHTSSVHEACYFNIVPGGVFAMPMQVGRLYFKAITATVEASLAITFGPETCDPAEMTAADQFDLVEELDPDRTNLLP